MTVYDRKHHTLILICQQIDYQYELKDNAHLMHDLHLGQLTIRLGAILE